MTVQASLPALTPYGESLKSTPAIAPLPWLARGRVPVLDGFRALSIALVLFSHALPHWKGNRWGLRLPGRLGVTFFFVISGFLITLLLLRERAARGEVSLKKFYARRALRLMPAMFVFLLAAYVVSLIAKSPVAPMNWLMAATYTTSFTLHRDPLIGHTWSLAVEEHFYLLWPALLCLLRPRRAALLAAAYTAATPVIRYVVWKKLGDHWDIDIFSPVQMSSISVGCVLAYLLFEHHDRMAAVFARIPPLLVAGAAMAVVVISAVLNVKSGKYHIILSDPVDALAAAVLLVALFFSPRAPWTRLLNTRPFIIVGVLSYSLYLWQALFIHASDAWYCQFPINIIASLLVAAACYFLIESPFLRLKSRYAAPRPA